MTEKQKEWFKANEERLKEKRKQYYKDNIEKIKEYRIKNKDKIKQSNNNYINKNKAIVNQKRCIKHKIKISTDKLFQVKHNIRSMFNRCFKSKDFIKLSKSEIILGCSYPEFKLYLESKFQPWMNWDNYGKYNGQTNYGWDIDHIIPLASAKNIENIIRLNHFTNLQPLCGYTNRYIKRNII